MLNKKLTDLINQQINMEWFSAYLYLDIFSYYTDKSLGGFANWFHVQTQEERDHAMLFIQYLLNNGEAVKLEDVKAPGNNFKDFMEPLTASLEHERKVTASINSIYSEAYALKDFRTMQFLDWFVKEQGEEEKNSEDNIKRFELFGNDPKSLYSLDTEMGTRVYAPPSLVL
ncbi:ferritin [Papillibacter cinnamivorans]|uniref:Ferritin n=1 Tax=Papillibacter cinnamivorans DSM 12816 TaxID=1122930 RepID=A0A1W2B7L2_9FIRM|nr:ferritin [Papillibacter cinnamivorans]SMC68916.1 ferritin [Papillibacter cinnamivorans DSM 12816]